MPRNKEVTLTYPGRASRVLVRAIASTSFMLLAFSLWAQGRGAERSIGLLDVLLLPRVWVGALFCLAGLVLLMRSRLSRNLRLAILPVVFFVFAVSWSLPLGRFAAGMGIHPSPICTATKPFLFLKAGYGVPIVFIGILLSIVVLSVVGNKLFCGWVCPIGAAQEACHRIPLPSRMKKIPSFKASNTVRIGAAVAFGVVMAVAGVSVYDYANPFEMLHWQMEIGALVIFASTLVAGAFVFRPFCYFLCPVGLLTWVCEHASVLRVRLNKDLCTECEICVDESPCPAVRAILDGRRSRPDCHACGHCIESCPEGALKFK
jgi:ferredoxin-type protein NapH